MRCKWPILMKCKDNNKQITGQQSWGKMSAVILGTDDLPQREIFFFLINKLPEYDKKTRKKHSQSWQYILPGILSNNLPMGKNPPNVILVDFNFDPRSNVISA